MSNTVISVEKLAKKYRLGVINRQMLVDQIESWVCRRLGKPDPHSSVFEQMTDRMPTPYDFWAIQDITFDVQRGDILGIMGRNGSGKSTLLKILSRITAPTEGTAKIKGRVASLLEVGTGFNYELTGKENVYLNGSILGLKVQEISARYDRIRDFAEIHDFMDTPVKRYSSGMRVRLAFAVAAHLEPDILILDEVLAVGDAKFQEKCLNRIEEIKDSGVTILFVSHSAQSVLKLCTKGLILDEGRVVAAGTAQEATERYLESLNLKTGGHALEGMPESHVGILVGQACALFLERLKDGIIVGTAAISTADGERVVDGGWIASSRFSTLRTEPTWSAAPDVSVLVVGISRSYSLAEIDAHHLLRVGAREVWIIMPDGQVRVHKLTGVKRLIQDPPKQFGPF
jgi:lipopolysaccharide transport system ATP-binding protein